jgi:adenylate cyclase
MVGYSRLMEADETGTIERQKTHRAELIDPKITEHHGRIVKTTGDGLLVEFASVVDAVACAVEIQRAMGEREAGVPEDRRIQYRVGINLGDIVIDEDDIYGDGVNIAARLQELTEPGGVSVSGTAYEHLKAKVEVGYEYLGEQRVKNIEKPVPVYRALLDPEDAGKVVGVRRNVLRPWVAAAAAAGLVALVGAGGLFIWQPWVQREEPARLERMMFPLPDKPSIAVLPFDNLSADTEQAYLADGIAENIIATLSQMPDLFVIARNSSFTYKGKPVKVQEVAESLGVQYILEGSVQRSDETIRITAQLIDAITGHHVWSQRYDRQYEDLFAVLDDVTREVVLALQIELTSVNVSKGTQNLEAWANATKGFALVQRFTKDENAKARELLEEAVRLDPGFASAWVFLALTHWADARFAWSESREESLAKAEEFGAKAMALDPRLPRSHSLFGLTHVVKRKYDQAIAFMEKAVALDPNDANRMAQLAANRMAQLAYVMTQVGRPVEAGALLEKAMRLNPYYPAWWLTSLGRVHRLTGHYDKSIAVFERAKDRTPGDLSVLTELLVAYTQAGRQADAEGEAAHILKIRSGATVRKLTKTIMYKDPKERERILGALRKAGIPE